MTDRCSRSSCPPDTPATQTENPQPDEARGFVASHRESASLRLPRYPGSFIVIVIVIIIVNVTLLSKDIVAGVVKRSKDMVRRVLAEE